MGAVALLIGCVGSFNPCFRGLALDANSLRMHPHALSFNPVFVEHALDVSDQLARKICYQVSILDSWNLLLMYAGILLTT